MRIKQIFILKYLISEGSDHAFDEVQRYFFFCRAGASTVLGASPFSLRAKVFSCASHVASSPPAAGPDGTLPRLCRARALRSPPVDCASGFVKFESLCLPSYSGQRCMRHPPARRPRSRSFFRMFRQFRCRSRCVSSSSLPLSSANRVTRS